MLFLFAEWVFYTAGWITLITWVPGLLLSFQYYFSGHIYSSYQTTKPSFLEFLAKPVAVRNEVQVT